MTYHMTCVYVLQLLDGMGGQCRKLLDLYQVFVKAMADEEDDVCSNAVYGMGLLAANAVPEIQR